MDANEFIGKVSAVVAGLLFAALAILLWVGFAGLATYPLVLRVVLGAAILAYGGWRIRRAWFAHGSRREN